jgi:iron complex outermembrane recepter protein
VRSQRTPKSRALFRGAMGVILLVCLVASAVGQAPQGPKNLATMSMQDLMNIEVTSVSKKEQKLSDVAAAIYVITQDDIRRSGAANIPDLLRMVPGMDVAQINANTWAISARGFNHQFSDKLLVLIDGRAVYTPLLGGVNWDTQDVPLEDIDRIEVIRGPGATIWGANAVDGVINIVTTKADDTQGGLVSGGGGTESQAYGTVRYGGKLSTSTNYRVFAKYLHGGALPELDGDEGEDSWNLLHGGFRTDATISQKDALTVQGDLYTGGEGGTIIHIFSVDPPVIGDQDLRFGLSGGNVLGRWEHSFSSRSETTLQIYFDNYKRLGPQARETRDTLDFDFNHHFRWRSRQDLVWGVGYRRTWDNTLGTLDQSFVPPNTALQLFNSFIQDTVALEPGRVSLTIGTKLENSYYSGADLEPSARLAWTPSSTKTFWAAVSEAEQAPDRRLIGLEAALAVFPDPQGSANPVEVIVLGNPQFAPEQVLSYEAGYRTEPNQRLSIDLSAFFNRYYHLESLEPGPERFQAAPAPARLVMPITFGNLMYGTTEGAELAVSLKLTNRWTLNPGYAFLEMHLHTEPSSQDTTSPLTYQGSNPQHQAQLRSHVELFHNLSWDANGYFVSALPAEQVPSYARVDSQLSMELGERTRLSLIGQNLLYDHHLESLDVLTAVNPALIKRSVYAKVTWRF